MKMMSGYLFGMCVEGRQISQTLLGIFEFPNLFALSEWLFGAQGNVSDSHPSLWKEEKL